MCTDVLMNDYVGRGKETFTYMYKECKHYTTDHYLPECSPIVREGCYDMLPDAIANMWYSA